uniref:CMRF35-like molecule 7 isoform X2 n=1 Tax=Solea senegalensis TaxID=28829 RepID=UPI001CD8E64A|nr:CMRF35-like molecule 7 isoform X2 [Solea senegalensis]
MLLFVSTFSGFTHAEDHRNVHWLIVSYSFLKHMPLCNGTVTGIMWRLFFHLSAVALGLIWQSKHTVASDGLSTPDEVTAAHGGSVTVECHYDQQFRENTKYWCKGPVYVYCKIVAKTPRNRPSDRCFIADDKEAGVFTVTMTGLQDSDDDLYWCVIAKGGLNIHTPVRLLVSHTVVTPTAFPTVVTPTPTWTLGHDDISWWATLRWILFVCMMCCLVSVHIVVWGNRRWKKNGIKS